MAANDPFDPSRRPSPAFVEVASVEFERQAPAEIAPHGLSKGDLAA
jgi:hypothetical protein